MFNDQLPQDFPAKRVLIAVSGSIAAASVPVSVMVMRSLLDLEVRALLTRQAATMVAPRALAAACGHPVMDVDGPPWDGTVPHIELTRWADVMLVLPATANVLAKAASGVADDLVSTCIVAAACPVIFVPAMNEVMWRKPAVQRNVATLIDDGYRVLAPAEGTAVVDGRIGAGGLPDILTVLRETADFLRHRDGERAHHRGGTGGGAPVRKGLGNRTGSPTRKEEAHH